MKIINTTTSNRVHVINNRTDVWNVLRTVVDSGTQEDAFYICDIGEVVRKHKIWKILMPRVVPHYAVKCNDNMAILEVLAALGTGFDCASKTEINKVLSLGVDSDRIIFANPAKPASHIRHAAVTGVNTMTFDNETELHKIKNFFPEAKLVIRIRCDAKLAQCQLGMKFGCDAITEVPYLLSVARDLGLDVIGVSFHVGSGCGEPDAFRRAIASSRQVFDYAASLGYNFNLLDIGGGYPGGRGDTLEPIAEIINDSLDKYFPDPHVRIIAEPGRFYVTSAYTLACNIHSIRTIKTEDPITKNTSSHYMYYINDGVYGSFNCILYDHQVVTPQPFKNCDGLELHSSSIWGPTCDGLDQVIEECMLPELKVGEWIIFEDMGAYTLPVASPFNGFPVPKVHVIADEYTWDLLKGILPLREDHFMLGQTPANIRASLQNDDNLWTFPKLPITVSISKFNNNSIIQEHVLELVDVNLLQ